MATTAPTPTPEAEWLRTDEVAATLRMSTRSVQRLIAAGDLPGVRIGGVYRVPVEALEARLVPQQVAPAPLHPTSQRKRAR